MNNLYPDLESYIINAIICGEQELTDTFIGELSAELFTDMILRRVFVIAQDLYNNGILPDLVTVGTRLRDRNDQEAWDAVVEASDDIATPSRIKLYIQELHNGLYVRNMRSAAQRIQSWTTETAIDIESLHTKAEVELLNVARDSQVLKPAFKSASTGLEERAQEIIDCWANRGGLRGLATGLKHVDDKVHGFKPGELTILAGRPSTGKTALATQILLQNAATKHPVLFFSLEMTLEALQERILMHGADDGMVDETGYAPPEVLERSAAYMQKQLEDRLIIDDSSSLNEAQIRARTHKAIQQYGIELVAIDYLQLMQYSGDIENNQIMLSNISGALKAMAKDFRIPVLCLSQLSRKSGDYGEPNLSDLRGSGAIEQDADVVLMLWRPESSPSHTHLKIPKSRNGQLGKFEMRFNPKVYDFTILRELDD